MKSKSFLYYWLPVLLVMATIFLLSSRQSIDVSETQLVNFLIFKSLHMIEYAVLFFLLFRAYHHSYPAMNIQKKLLLCFFIASFYGTTDELHQTFVPTREGKIRDVIIDMAGIALMYSYIKRYLNRIPKFML